MEAGLGGESWPKREKRRGVTVTDATHENHVHVTTPALCLPARVKRTTSSTTAPRCKTSLRFSLPLTVCLPHPYTLPECPAVNGGNRELSVWVGTFCLSVPQDAPTPSFVDWGVCPKLSYRLRYPLTIARDSRRCGFEFVSSVLPLHLLPDAIRSQWPHAVHTLST